ncbi:CCDC158 domain containing protein [Pyrenophora teres f. maculata]|nr:CCDC158 domain containing protein [Pyrenophora teres f. maculata]
MDNPETNNKSSVLEDEIMERPVQGKKKPVNLSIDTDIMSAEREDWGKNTVNNSQIERCDNSPLFTPSPHTPSPRNLHGSVLSPPSILRRPSKRLAKPPTYDAPTKASEAKKNEKLEFPVLVKRRDSGKDRPSRSDTSDGQSPSVRSERTSAPSSRPPSAVPLTPVNFEHEGYAHTDGRTGIDTNEEQLVKEEHADSHLRDLVAETKRLQDEDIGFMELQQEKDEALSRVSQLEQDNTKLIQERDQLLIDVQKLKLQKEEFWRRDLPPNASAKAVTIEDLEWNNAGLRQELEDKDEKVVHLQRDNARLQDDLKTKQEELDGADEYAKQGQDRLDDQIEENGLIIQRQQDLIKTLSTLMEKATQSISEDSDMEHNEIYHLLLQLTAQFETVCLYEKIYALFQAFSRSKRLLQSTNEDLKHQLHYMERQITKLEAAAKTPPPAEVRISSSDIASPLSPQSPMSPLQSDRKGIVAIYRNEVDKHKYTKVQLKQAHFEKARLCAEITAYTEKISNLEQLLLASQNDSTNLTNRVNELQSEAQSWKSELAESKSQLDLRTSAFEQQAHRTRQECIRQIKSYYTKTADESNWRVTTLQARLSALQDDHKALLDLFNAAKREKASLEEEIVRRKTFALDPRFADHANAVREKHAGRRPLPSLALPVKPDEHENLVMPETPATPLVKKEKTEKSVPMYQLPGVKAAYLNEAKEYRERLRLRSGVKDDLLAFCVKRPDVKSMEKETLVKHTGLGGMGIEPVVSIHSPREKGVMSAMVSPREGTTTPFSSLRFLSPTGEFPPMPTSRFLPTITATPSTILPTSSLTLTPSIPATSSSSLFPITPSAFPTQEAYTSAMSAEIVHKMRKRKMGKALYPPGRKSYEEVKKMTAWEMWEGAKWAEEEASVREIEILRKRGVVL